MKYSFFLVLLLIPSSIAATPRPFQAGYTVVSLSESAFPTLPFPMWPALRVLHESAIVVKVHPTVPLPTRIWFRRHQGLNFSLPVTGYGSLGGGYYQFSTGYGVVTNISQGTCLVTAENLAVDVVLEGMSASLP